MRVLWRVLVPPLAALGLLAACGGGGGGGSGGGGTGEGGGGTPPPTGLAFTAEYVPLATSDRRRWRLVSDGQPQVASTERIGSPVTLAGYAGFALRDQTGEARYVARTSTGLFELAGPGSDPLTVAAGAAEVLRFGLRAGDRVELFNRTLQADIDGDGRPDSIAISASFTVLGFETVTVPAGTFAGAARVQTDAISTVSLTAGGSGTVTVTAEEWYARDIGRVRALTTTRIDAQAPTVDTEELTDYGVGPLRSDTVAPRVLSVTPADGAAASPDAVLNLRFSEALDILDLDSDDGLRLTDAAGRVVPTTYELFQDSPDTQSITLRPIAALPDGEYRLRVGPDVVDWANNALQGADVGFRVDTMAPQVVSSVPVRNDVQAALEGVVSITFNEDVVTPDEANLFIEIWTNQALTLVQRLPATITGPTLSATLAAPLQRNTAYLMRVSGTLEDLTGNAVSWLVSDVLFRTDPGPLARPQRLIEGLASRAVRYVDVDGDGRADLLYAGIEQSSGKSVLQWQPGLVGGGFDAPRLLIELAPVPSCEAYELAVGDFDGDGRADIAVPCGFFLRVFLQSAPGQYSQERPGFNGALGLSAWDFDGDGRAELALVGTPPGTDVGAMTSWFVIGRGSDGVWQARATVEPGGSFVTPPAAVVADIDNDGRRDLVWLRSFLDESLELAWALGRADGTFAAVQSRQVGGDFDGFGGIAVGDLQGDGLAQVVVVRGIGSNDQGELIVLRGRADGGFDITQRLATDRQPYGVALGDINDDGRDDVIVSHVSTGLLGIHLQATDGNLEPERSFESGSQDYLGSASLLVLDLNHDGRQDLLTQTHVLLGRPTEGVWPASALGRAAMLGQVVPARPRSTGLWPALSRPGSGY